MKSAALGILTFLLIAASPASAQDLAPGALLRKLSLHIRGVTPSLQEYQELESSKNPKKLIAQKTAEYLADPRHAGKMISRLDGLFKLKAASGMPEGSFNPSNTPDQFGNIVSPAAYETLNTMDQIFRDMAEQNLSWDTLLLSKKLKIGRANGQLPDLAFYSAIAPSLPFSSFGGVLRKDTGAPTVYDTSSYYTFVPHEFSADDERIAGAITTSRFFGRYGTTNLNKNRGRAAAMFRIFLCDDMKPVVVASDSETQQLIDQALAGTAGANAKPEITHATEQSERLHGSEPACMACHYKLDPMGRAFETTGILLSPDASPGELVFRREDGSLVQIPGKGIGDLAKAIVQQPEYASCQVRHFWSWFVGDDVPLSANRLKELTRAFEKVGRRTNDFVAHVVSRPEFTRDSSATNAPTLLNVKPTLSRCSQCHTGGSVPDFTSLPIGGTKDSQAEWLAKISTALDLVNDGADKTMPPSYSDWQPGTEEISQLKRWIQSGALDANGKPTGDVAAIPMALAADSAPAIKFQGTRKRYLSAHDIQRLFAQRFPSNLTSQVQECRQFGFTQGSDPRTFTGTISAITGEPTINAPSPAFVRWFSGCINSLAPMDIGARPEAYLGATAHAQLTTKHKIQYPSSYGLLYWKELDAPIQREVLRNLAIQWLGTPVVTHEQAWVDRLHTAIETASLATPGNGLNLGEAITQAIIMITLSDDFLSY